MDLGSAGGAGVSLQLDLKSPFTAKDFSQQRSVAQGSTKKVTHLGDAAFSEQLKLKGTFYDDLWVRKGTVAFRLEILRNAGSPPLVHLAQLILPKL